MPSTMNVLINLEAIKDEEFKRKTKQRAVDTLKRIHDNYALAWKKLDSELQSKV